MHLKTKFVVHIGPTSDPTKTTTIYSDSRTPHQTCLFPQFLFRYVFVAVLQILAHTNYTEISMWVPHGMLTTFL